MTPINVPILQTLTGCTSPFRYFEELCELKRQAGRALLTWNELQGGLNTVNSAVQEEHDRECSGVPGPEMWLMASAMMEFNFSFSTLEIISIELINQALCRSDPQKTLAALLLPSGGLEEVQPSNARRYHDVLTQAKRHKAEVRPSDATRKINKQTILVSI